MPPRIGTNIMMVMREHTHHGMQNLNAFIYSEQLTIEVMEFSD